MTFEGTLSILIFARISAVVDLVLPDVLLLLSTVFNRYIFANPGGTFEEKDCERLIAFRFLCFNSYDSGAHEINLRFTSSCSNLNWVDQ